MNELKFKEFRSLLYDLYILKIKKITTYIIKREKDPFAFK